MGLTIDQLRNGISCWRRRNWERDFENSFYEHKLVDLRSNGLFNNEWWSGFYPVLQKWKATRTSVKGHGRAFLTSRAQARFTELNERWTKAIAPHLDKDIGGVEWRQIEVFPSLVAEIKDVPSQVFT